MTLHALLDHHYGPDGPARLRQMLDDGAGLDAPAGLHAETPLHVATRRRRLEAAEVLLRRGAAIDARTAGGKTAYAHAARRGFHEVAALLRSRGATTTLTDADRLAVALSKGDLGQARTLLARHPAAARTGNPEEDRLLADVAGRNASEPVAMLLAAGADLTAAGLDGGTPLHQAAWFGQPANARLLLDAGAPLEAFDATHRSSPLGWAVHGARYSGGAAARQAAYVSLVQMLLDAGARRHYPGDPDGEAYHRRLLDDATPPIRAVLAQTGA